VAAVTTLAAMQPSYMPWLGLFSMMHEADIFVIRDDVPIGGPSWRNRNRLKGPNGPVWMTIPLKRHSDSMPIRDVQVRPGWEIAHLKLFRGLYEGMPFYGEAQDRLLHITNDARAAKCVALHDIAWNSTAEVMDALKLGGANNRPPVLASELGLGPWAPDEPNERLIKICKTLGANHYLAVPASRDYMKEELWRAAGIKVEYFEFLHPEYPQRFPPFVSHLSVLDAIANVGLEGTRGLLVGGKGST